MSDDPKAGEKAYYARLGEEGRRHALEKPFSDPNCGKYLCNLGSLLLMLEPAPRSVLDFGCGTGWTTLFLARAGYDVLGVDIAEDAIAMARAHAAETGVSGAAFEAADYEGFQTDRLFDYVLFYDSLHHAEDEAAALAAAHRALKPGGVLFAFEPGRGHSRSARARHAVSEFGVHEKDMPPSHIWRLGKRIGFSRALFLPLPHEAARGLYRRDYLRARGPLMLQLERLWGFYRAASQFLRLRRLGLVVMWK
jgi:SAM-dependent methyltransferase